MSDSVPNWINDETVKAILVDVIKKLDKAPAEERKTTIIYTSSHRLLTKLLRPSQAGESDIIWEALKLAEHDGVILLKRRRKNLELSTENVAVEFVWQAEEKVRIWLNMPLENFVVEWRDAVIKANKNFNKDYLIEHPLRVKGMNASETVERLGKAREHLLKSNEKYTLRQISAMFFRSDSKSLESKTEEWLQEALNVSYERLQVRKVDVLVSLPDSKTETLLFIENLDTFHFLSELNTQGGSVALVYLSGFKGTASRIRRKEGVQMFHSGNPHKADVEEFNNIWFEGKNAKYLVWADLDYAGLSIAISLKQSFPELEWFDEAYRLMLERLFKNEGHEIEGLSSKGKQLLPDLNLLWAEGKVYYQAIRECQQFVDQESVSPHFSRLDLFTGAF